MRKLWIPIFCISILFAAIVLAQPIRITVDATDAPRRVLHSHLVIPVQPGPLALWYPKWIPGEHGPTGPLTQMVGLKISANGNTIAWSRDLRDMFEFHVDVPQGANAIDVDMDYLDPVGSGAFSAGGSMTPDLAVISWNTVLLYPAAKSSEDLTYEATLRIPAGWQYATALTTTAANNNEIHFAPLTLTHLIDSPVLAAQHMRKIDVPSASPFPHHINIAADSNDAMSTTADFPAQYGRLVDEERAAFGAEHFRHYDWLLTLSDSVAHFGLEHHESSDDRTDEDTLGSLQTRYGLAELLAHEYTHSWNGKYRRPAGLAVPNYDVPMTGELLWVYEGLTEFVGYEMPARAGLTPPEYYRESVATIAAAFANLPGRAWRPLLDTAVDAQDLYGAPGAWESYRRGTDFYDESLLLWLDVDMTIRKLTNDKRSLDDFLKAFEGGPDGDPVVKPYTFDDVVKALNGVAANDWATFLNMRLRSTTSAPLGGLEASGWRLSYDTIPNAAQENQEKRHKNIDESTTVGMTISNEGRVGDVRPGSAAAKAGIVPGAHILAVNGRHFTTDLFRTAVRESKNATGPMQVIYESEDFVNVANVDYHDGARYPHLVRIEGVPDRLSEMIAPHARK